MAVVDVQNVSRTYGLADAQVRALDRVSLQFQERCFAAVVGPSGSGKTTLLNLVGCLDKPSAGTVTVDDTNVATLSPKNAARFRGERIGFIFQSFNLLPVLTVYENVEYPLVMVRQTPEGERRERVMRQLEAVGMTDQAAKLPSQLSGGQKQRAAVARALVTDPMLVLADEPTANLDHDSAQRVLEIMHRMRDEVKTSFIFSTHDPKVMDQAETIHILEDGRLVETRSAIAPGGPPTPDATAEPSGKSQEDAP
jgi:putative ABC transport system ATP-binding protein